MIRLILDCFGGDRGPEAAVEGALAALAAHGDLSLVLTGDGAILGRLLEGKTYDAGRLTVEHAPEVIGCDEKPTDAIRLKKNSSMMRGITLLRTDDTVDGMVSVGSTGALVAASVLRIGRLRGVIRPAFCPILPTMNGGIVGLTDSGANVECSAEMLMQFAVMGSAYLESVWGEKLPEEKPRVALLNVGTEAEKGDPLRQEVYRLLSGAEGVHFVGNMESRDFLSGKYDLVVADGFSGNVLVKATEGACLELLKRLKGDFLLNLRNKLGALLLKKTLVAEKEFMDYQNYGGSVLLGCSKIIVKGHGSSKASAIRVCIEQAYRMASEHLCEKMEARLDALTEG